mmetsp:Transcript_8660/g.22542  ORF Transcript_8660/g.22542 Transcript_8660/m.22542 type:complete len:123 (-) Transcript_8660:1224-1592(-)
MGPASPLVHVPLLSVSGRSIRSRPIRSPSFAASEAIDENKNGLLESDEIYNALRYCGIRLSADELDYMLTSVKHVRPLAPTARPELEFAHSRKPPRSCRPPGVVTWAPAMLLFRGCALWVPG